MPQIVQGGVKSGVPGGVKSGVKRRRSRALWSHAAEQRREPILHKGVHPVLKPLLQRRAGVLHHPLITVYK